MQKVTDKTLADFEQLTPLVQVRLDKYDRGVNNNKFWHGFVHELDGKHYFVRHWGRNGAKGQSQVELGYSKYECMEELKKLERSKRKDGYENDPSLLEKIAREVAD